METYTNANIRSSACQRRDQRIRQRRKRQVRLFGISVPIIALLLFWSLRVLGPTDDAEAMSPSDEITSPKMETDMSAPLDPPREVTQSHVSDWNLILVNPWNSIPAEYEITFTQLKNGHAVDERCYPDLQDMMDACRAAGLSPMICSSYRTQEKQEQLFNNKVNALISEGLSEADAKIEAGKAVAIPGTSEHQLGLAVDIVDINNQNLNSSQEKTAVQIWLMEHSWEYGFILRYPSDKSEITGIMFEPWHYRYVGKEAAEYIYENNLCLEEYLEQLP